MLNEFGLRINFLIIPLNGLNWWCLGRLVDEAWVGRMALAADHRGCAYEASCRCLAPSQRSQPIKQPRKWSLYTVQTCTHERSRASIIPTNYISFEYEFFLRICRPTSTGRDAKWGCDELIQFKARLFNQRNVQTDRLRDPGCLLVTTHEWHGILLALIFKSVITNPFRDSGCQATSWRIDRSKTTTVLTFWCEKTHNMLVENNDPPACRCKT